MLSQARTVLRKLRASNGRNSRSNNPIPSDPATTTTTENAPHAIHISDAKPSPTKKNSSDAQSITLIVVDTQGATDYWGLYRLLQREKNYGSEFDPTDEPDTVYFCDNHIYNVLFIPPTTLTSAESYTAFHCQMQHICLVFTYDASSRASWDEVVTTCKRIRTRCNDHYGGVLPFLTIMIVAIDEEGEGEGKGKASVSHAEAKAFATQRGYLFVKTSPTTGRGVCDAVGSVVELAHGAQDRYTMDEKGYSQRYKRAGTLQALFS